MMANVEITEVQHLEKHDLDSDKQSSPKRLKFDNEDKIVDTAQTVLKYTKPSPSFYGLTEFISTSFTPISGELKERYEDFIVTEVERNGNKSHLTSFDIPTLSSSPTGCSTQLMKDQIAQLNKLLMKEVETVKMLAPNDKEERTNIHNAIKLFSDKIYAITTQEGEERFIVVNLVTNGMFTRQKFPKDQRSCHFTLYKWNIGTQEAISRISRTLQMKTSRFAFAGTKDKRGVTSQRVSGFCVHAGRLNGLNKKHLESVAKGNSERPGFLNGPPFLVGNFTYESEQLHLGQLSGNRFIITLREVAATVEDIKCAVESCRDNGFINYFGMQRFGNTGYNYLVGKYLLSEDYKSAIETILIPNKNQKHDILTATTHFKNTANAETSFCQLTYSKQDSEGLILRSLSRNKTNYLGAFNKLPRNTQLLYLHSYQSYIWNLVLSKRLQSYGDKVLPGDLVYSGEGKSDSNQWARRAVRQLTDEEVDKTDITDIVLPLAGHSVTLPGNDCKQFLLEFLERDGITLEKLSGLHKQLSLPGEYRHIVMKPTEVSWRSLKYSSDDEKLILTDEDVMRKIELGPLNVGDKNALQISFDLPSSTYATMMMRELTRGYTDT